MAEIGIGAAASVSSEVAKGIFHQAKRHARYVFVYKKNVKKFEERLAMLIAKREGVQQVVDAAERNGEKRKADVQDWFDRVDKAVSEEATKEVNDLLDKAAKRKCFIGLCPDIKSRYKLSKKAEKDGNNLVQLIRQGGAFKTVSYLDVPQDMITAANSKDFEAFESRKEAFDQIMAALRSSTINMMGVYGMSGVGKTTLVKEVVRHVQKESLFDSMLMAVVTPSPDIEKLQDEIAEPLGLYLEEKSLTGRANRLRERLMNEKKILIILDDIWGRLDLNEVGIPFGDDEHKGCKILLTSRDENVLTTDMDAQKIFPIRVLEDNEAWNMFKKMAGGKVESSSELQSTAIEVAMKCGGLPMAIKTVAKALKNKGLSVWKDALKMLQTPSPTNFTGIPAFAYKAIELSYIYLESDEHRHAFLLCSMLGRDIDPSDLLRYSMGLRLFNYVNTMAEAEDRLLTVVSDLKAASLLNEHDGDSINMHDLIRDVALAIASRDNSLFFLKENAVLEHWPDDEMMKKYNKIVFRYPTIMTRFPDELNSPELAFLFLAGKSSSIKLSPNIFKRMINLQVLSLAGVHFSMSLPPSISVLANLRTLCLSSSEFGDIAIIGELKNLEILSLSDSVVEELAKEVGELEKLKVLDLSNCSKLKVIRAGIFSRLSQLEELYMGNSFVQWEEATDQEKHGNPNLNASIAELKALSCLDTLELHILDAKIVPKDYCLSQNLRQFKIFIGEGWDWNDKNEYSRTLKLQLNSTTIHLLDHWAKPLLKRTEALYIADLQDVETLLEPSNKEAFMGLKSLYIRNGSRLQHIINDNIDGAVNKMEFLRLQSLRLENLPQLVSFGSGSIKGSASIPQHNHLPLFSEQFVFPRLENLSIQGCGKLEHLFSPSIARSLLQLKSLEMEQCSCLRDVIFNDGIEKEKTDVICFPLLNSLVMKDLQNLNEFCSANYKIEFPSLKILGIDRCLELKEFTRAEEKSQFGVGALFNDKVAVPCLERMTVSHLKNVKMIFDKTLVAGSFCKLQDMSVEHCDELLTIFSSNIIEVFQSLQQLSLRHCGSVEVIFEVGAMKGLKIKEPHDVVDSQLRRLEISGLGKLKHVWDRDPQGILTFQNLRNVDISLCGSLKNVFPASIAKDLPRLEDLKLSFCGVEEIVSAELVDDQEMEVELPISFKFPQLSSLWLTNLEELKCFYPGLHTISWPVLKKLDTYLTVLFKIVGSQHPSNGTQEAVEVMNGNDQTQSTLGQPLFSVQEVFPQLEELRLHSYSDIAMMCDGRFPADLFRYIKSFQLFGGADFVYGLLPRFYNLENLNIFSADLKGVDHSISVTQAPGAIGTVSRLRQLMLGRCFNIQHLWKKDSELAYILPSLETLVVVGSDDLIKLNFGPSSSSFRSLTNLHVGDCGRMISLVTPSVVENLVQLTIMVIYRCNAMTEIVANEEDTTSTSTVAANGVTICFSKLKFLQLNDLRSLVSFCPAENYSFEFPSLQELFLSNCPRLKIFCLGLGASSTPQLQRVRQSANDPKGRWAGELNLTIQQLYGEKVGYRGLCDLEFSDTNPDLMEIWNRNPQEILDLKNLGKIQFCNCSSLKYIFTPFMVLSLLQLKSLEVVECNTIEAVIIDDQEATTDNLIFPRLESITIQSCYSLTSFYLSSGALAFPWLNLITIGQCPKMTTFASSLGHAGDLNTAPFFNDKVVCPELNNLALSSLNIQKIWHDQPLPSLYLEKLYYLRVKGCHNLEYLFPSFMLKHLVQLSLIQIEDCKMMEQVIVMQGFGEEERKSSPIPLLFPNLGTLWLMDLSNLSRFCSTTYFEFPCLTSLILSNCPLLKTFIPNSVNVRDELQIHQNALGINLEVADSALFDDKVVVPSLELLTIKGMSDCRKIWQDQLREDSFTKLNEILVEGCQALLNIFPLNMMERLKELKTLLIVNCDSVQEIIEPRRQLIANKSQTVTVEEIIATQGVILFTQLEYLELTCLPSLASFCLEDHNLEFPALHMVTVRGCPKMMVFCEGELSSPLLQADLKTAVRQDFEEMNVQNSQVSYEPTIRLG